MRSLERNKVTIYYALYSDKTEILDEYGQGVGEYISGYGNPVKFKIRVSPGKGKVEEQLFGKELAYSKVLCTADHSFPITETSRLWIDTLPVINPDGTTTTPHDYEMVCPKKDLNEWAFAVKKVR